MSVFGGVESAKIGKSYNNLEIGDYDLEVMGGRVVEQDRKGTARIEVEFIVRGSNVPQHPAGTKVDWANFKNNDAFLSNAKEFGKAILETVAQGEVSENDITQLVLEQLFADNGKAMQKVRLRCKVVQKTSAPKIDKVTQAVIPGHPYKRHFWYGATVTAQAATTAA